MLVGGAAAALVASTLSVSSASGAASSTTWSGPASYVPLRNAVQAGGLDTRFGNVDYNGGAVMPTNTDYLVFWSPKGLSAYGSGAATPEYVTGLEQYFKDLAQASGTDHSTDSVATQYNDLTGATVHFRTTFGGAFVDTDPYPMSKCPVHSPVTHCVTDPQIQQELEKVAAAHHVTLDLSHEFFLLTPPHVESCFSGNASATPPFGGCSAGELPSGLEAYCAYHGNTSLSPMLFYANDPFVTGNAGCDDGNHPNGPSDGALEGGLSHEHNESITDPIPNDAWTNGAGANHGLENGDQCEGHMGTALGTAPNGAKFNQEINGHFYWYQEEWSNIGHKCLQRLALPTSLPTATFKVTAGSGLTLKFNATGSTAPGGVADYVWQFNSANGAQTIEKTAPTITHTFPSAGAYSVGLTVYASNGASKGAGGIVRTGHSGFAAGFTSTKSGLTVSFSGLANVSAKPVKTYLWEFGDGHTGSGRTPKHAYAKAGTYTVKVVEFSGVGSAFPGAGAAPIFAKAINVS
ncbi:MAG: PKD domain-containing protein [Acidimicrobiaceae bacterium]|nr:PKD domain-containing protein [Acidimicrobiaceae bacterium]